VTQKWIRDRRIQVSTPRGVTYRGIIHLATDPVLTGRGAWWSVSGLTQKFAPMAREFKRHAKTRHRCLLAAEEIEFRLHFLGFRLLLRLLSFCDDFAECARVFAVESFLDSDSEWRMLRVADDHACPGDRLEKCPVPANRANQRGRHRESEQAGEHSIRAYGASNFCQSLAERRASRPRVG